MRIEEHAKGRAAPAPDDGLTERVSHFHLRQRLGIEQAKEAWVFGQGLNSACRVGCR